LILKSERRRSLQQLPHNAQQSVTDVGKLSEVEEADVRRLAVQQMQKATAWRREHCLQAHSQSTCNSFTRRMHAG
jgi:hypothetical protein